LLAFRSPIYSAESVADRADIQRADPAQRMSLDIQKWGEVGVTSDRPNIDFDNSELRRKFLAKRQNPRSLNNQVDGPTLISMLGALESKDVLEIGCGVGDLAHDIAKCNIASYFGVDISGEMISTAKSRTVSRCQFERMDIEQRQLPEAAFDAAVSALTFHFLDDLPTVLTKIRRSLRPGGLLAFSIRHPLRTCNPQGLGHDLRSWTVQAYFDEGPRDLVWHGHHVRIFHRSISSVVSSILKSGLRLSDVREISPEAQSILEEDSDHVAIPGFLYFLCFRPA
jgi:SAM-dependent methyltransferase